MTGTTAVYQVDWNRLFFLVIMCTFSSTKSQSQSMDFCLDIIYLPRFVNLRIKLSLFRNVFNSFDFILQPVLTPESR